MALPENWLLHLACGAFQDCGRQRNGCRQTDADNSHLSGIYKEI